MLDPKRDFLRYHAQNLAIADTIANWMNLAEEFVKQGMPEDAVPLYEKSLSGIYR